MRKLLLSVLGTLCLAGAQAQSTINIKSGTTVVGSGAVQVATSNIANFTNNGTYTDNTGTLNALSATTFGGSGTTTTNYLNINHGSGTTLFSSEVSVRTTATITSGTAVNAGSEKLYIRTDINSTANLVNNGVLSGTVRGLITNATVTTGSCPSFTSTLSLNISGTSMEYQWQSSADSASWGDISGATNATHTPTVTATTFYRCNLTTNNSGYAQSTPGVKLTLTGSAPGSITGTAIVCSGATTTLSNASSGGTWSSTSTSVATIGSTTGVVSGVSGGTTTISYTNACGSATQVVTVNASPTLSSVSNSGPVCAGGTLNLTSSVSGGSTPLSYSWSGPSSFSATTANPSVVSATTAATGVYTLTVSDANSCAALGTNTTSATVNELPSLSSINNTGPVCTGDNLGLSATVNGGSTPYSYSWAGPGSFSSTLSNPTISSVTTTASGIYTLSVTDANSCIATGTNTTSATVNSRPSLTSISNSGPICAGSTLNLSSSVSGGSTPYVYSWAGPSTYSSTANNPSIASATSGATGTYTLTVIDANSCTATGTNTTTATVNANPTITSVGNGGPVCAGTNLSLTSTVAGGSTPYSYSWGGPASFSSTLANPTISSATTAATGTYTLSVTDANSCTATGTNETTATVNALPNISSVDNSGPICTGDNLNLTSSVSGGSTPYSYSWTGPSTFSSTLDNPTIASATTAASGVYTLIVTDANSCAATGTNTTNATVNARPAITAVGNSGPICAGLNLNITSTVSGGSTPYTYSWTGPNTFSATIANPSVSGASTAASGIYTLVVTDANSCSATGTNTTSATVNPSPSITAISNNGPLCGGGTLNFTSSVSGGTTPLTYSWSGPGSFSSTVANPSISSATPAASGIYTLSVTDANSCAATGTNTTSATVSALPAITSVSNSGPICADLTLNLSVAVSGGSSPYSYSWAGPGSFSSTVGSPAIVSATTSATGVYTVTVTDVNGCTATGSNTTSATVYPRPAVSSITNNSPVCSGSDLNFTSSVSGGTTPYSYSWSGPYFFSSTMANPTRTGVNILSDGTYTLTVTDANSCTASGTQTSAATILAPISATTGPASICFEGTATLSNATGGGTWSSSNPGIASVNSSTGEVSGISVGVVYITYTVSSGCFALKGLNVNGLPSPITGASAVCESGFTVLSSATPGGVWSSSNTGVASVHSSTGGLTGVSSGTAIITYLKTFTGCYVTREVTVNTTPPSITGSSSLCVGASETFTSSPSGGVWSSTNTSVATVGSSSGTVSAVIGGLTTIKYELGTGCSVSKVVTAVNGPSSISGTLFLCPGGTTTLSSATSGGTWSSTTSAVATVASTTGVVTGISAGNTTISYTNGSGCATTRELTVMATPTAISGATSICEGATTLLSHATSGGAWSSSNASVASVVTTTGVVTGVSGGVATISYLLSGSGCYATTTVTVDAALPSISGTLNVCAGETTTLSHASGGGTWSSSNVSLATVGASTGVVTGVATGYVVITYTTGGGCYTTATVWVKPGPSPIYGASTICEGTLTYLGSAAGTGTWSSSDASVATIGMTSGGMTGISSGTATITYAYATGCYATYDVTVNAAPAGITGTTSVCQGSATTLSHTTAGGTWSSGNPAVATVGTTGIVSGINPGAVAINYALPGGCIQSTTVTVGGMPAAISGITSICEGGSTTLSSSGSGTWSSASTAVATVSSVTVVGGTIGVVTAVSPGTAIISFQSSGGCVRTTTVTVIAAPAANTGTALTCIGGTTTLSNSTGGGTWSSSNIARATVSGSGVVSGVAAGTVTITYTVSAGCFTTSEVTVTGTPTAITGGTKVCVGYTTALSHATPGGTWSSSNTALVTVDAATGVVTGVAVGVVLITYTTSPGCYTTSVMYSNGTPAPIAGATSMCDGGFTVQYNATSNGRWSSSDATVASIHYTSGGVTGVSAGTAVLSYTSLLTGCFSTRVFTVNPVPTGISGPTSLCTGTSGTFTVVETGGTWTSSHPAVASIDGSSGVINAHIAGYSYIIYTLPGGCYSYVYYTSVNRPYAITGPSSLATGASATLTSATPGGIWSSSSSGIASITSGGITTGVSTGLATITYTSPTTGCFATKEITVTSPKPGNSSLSETEEITRTSIFPNPSTGHIVVQTPTNGTMEIFSSDGKSVAIYSLSHGSNTIQLSNNLTSGMYSCRISNEGGLSETIRLILER